MCSSDLAPHHERVFSLARLFSAHPLEAWKNQVSQREVMQEVRRRLKKFKDVRVGVRAFQSSISVGGPNFDIDVALLGPDLDMLMDFAERLRKKAPEIGLLDADTSLRLDKPELRVEIDRARAAALGVDTQDIAAALRLMVGGDQRASRFRDPSDRKSTRLNSSH